MADVIELKPETRNDILVAFAQRRAAAAELKNGQFTVERLIEKFDQDGQLAKAIQESLGLAQQYQAAEQKLSAAITAAQAEAGRDLTGWTIDGNTGNIVPPKDEEKPAEAVAEAKPAKAKGKKK